MSSESQIYPHTSLHHLEVCCDNGESMSNNLATLMGMELYAQRETKSCHQWVLRRGEVIIVVTQRTALKDCDKGCNQHGSNCDGLAIDEDWTVFCCSADRPHKTDSVFNVALRVCDIPELLKRVADHKAPNAAEPSTNPTILKPLTMVTDKWGTLRYAIIKSCVGNVVHTLIDDSCYEGPFLPGYALVDDEGYQSDLESTPLSSPVKSAIVNSKTIELENTEESSIRDILYSDIDHIALACGSGEYVGILEWYSHCLHFDRFILNKLETEKDGFVISNKVDVGVRLLAMEYWKCREFSLLSSNPSNQTTGATSKRSYRPLQLVIAESYEADIPDQISKFLSAHGGSGIQHIAVSCPDIFIARRILEKRGLKFLVTPEAYYHDDEIVQRMIDIDVPMSKILNTGILVDMDKDPSSNLPDISLALKSNNCQLTPNDRYLFQIFSKPVFDADTFFIELIERHETKGFGAGNIPALWRAVKRYMDAKLTPLAFDDIAC